MRFYFKNYKKYQKFNWQIAFCSLRKVALVIFSLCLFFFSFPNQIRAQISSFIIEDSYNEDIGVTSLMNAAVNDDVRAASFFAKAGIKVINKNNIGGATALHIAARKGNLEICQLLLDRGAYINAIDNEGWNPLMRAATSGNDALVKMLIDNGADAKNINLTGETVIVNSVVSGCSKCLEHIFSRYDFIKNLDIKTLKKQLRKAVLIANNRNDLKSKSILTEYINIEVKNARLIAKRKALNDNNVVMVFRLSGEISNVKNMRNYNKKQSVVIQNSLDSLGKKNTNIFITKKDKRIRGLSSLYNNPNKKYNSKRFVFMGGSNGSKEFTRFNSNITKKYKFLINKNKKFIFHKKDNNFLKNTKVKYKFLGGR